MKKKQIGPDLKKWREFRYNLLKEDIEIDADREDDITNLDFDDTEGFTYKLKNGKTLEVEERHGSGMSDEPSSFILLSVDGKQVKFDDIKHLMRFDDARELEKYIDDTKEENEKNAVNWVKESKYTKHFDIAKWREHFKK